MSVYLRPARWPKFRVSKRSVRAGVGPRWRLWFGKGGRGVSTGAGPVSVYHPAGRRRRTRR